MSAPETPEEIPADEEVKVTFKEIGLGPKIIKALDDLGYEHPTPIQARAIPAALEQRDVLGIAQTGTGKTGAFVLPTMHKLARGRARARMPRCLIVCPTRELAAQVAENVELYGKYLKLEMALLIGGVSFAEQDKKLSKGVDVLIATPGRLLDQFERGKILMTGVQTLVVDEADRMLDMGFIPDIEKIFKITPFTRQVLFFSATMPAEIKRLVDQFLHQPVTIQVARRNMTAKTVTQRIVRMPSSDPKQKRTALRWLIEREDVDNGIIFCNRKKDVDIVAKSLSVHGMSAAPIHGDLAQSLRTETLEQFKNGEIKFLVASDVAARGLDVPSVSHVFNFDVPNHSEDYVHRIGRTGRAGRKGDAIMLVSRLDQKNYQEILNMIKVEEIEEIEIPGIEDFPKDGGKHRKSSRGEKGRGRDRNSRGGRDSGRSSRKPSRNSDEAAKEPARSRKTEDASNTETTTSDAKPKAKASRRRAAPKRPGQDTETKAESKTERTEPSSTDTATKDKRAKSNRRAAPKRKDAPQDEDSSKRGAKQKRDDRPKREDKPKRDNKQKRESRTKSSNSGNSDKRRHSRSDIGKADHKGFGDEMPAFFKRDL
ncbi:DEAD/DEAH box helicase [Litorimonas sp. RW-G-Af-16]|uniref:DEAD/DEAH box helicase n=2 Tax=Litorimonas sp. RW-G-Af-16 TaxID=3241168 RepID=UPI00390C7CF3